MRLRIIFAVFLLFNCSSIISAQETDPTSDPASDKSAETRLFDEFGKMGDCEWGLRIQNLFVELGNNSNSTGYIIVYRGADALPAEQIEAVLQTQFRRFKKEMAFLKLDESKVVIIDGGFRKSPSIWNQIWIVPEGGEIPKPTETVGKSKTPTEKAFKVDERGLEIFEAYLEKNEDIEESEQPTEEALETISEDSENVEVENPDEKNDEVADEFTEEIDEFYWTSDYFAEVLKNDRNAKGTVIFYADVEEYDIGKARQIVEEGLRHLAEKSKTDLTKVNLIFGGYRTKNTIEYWIVPKGATEPQPTPEDKVTAEN